MYFNKVRNYMEKALVDGYKVPGCDVIVMKNHKPYFRFSTGFSDENKTQPVSVKDLYFMYSCTKPITAVAAMRLVEEGVLGLDTPVEEYLPEYKDAFIEENGKRIKPKNKMTVRHLFTMTAGFDYDLDKAPTVEVLREYGDSTTTLQIANSLIKSPLCFSPGDKYQYSLCHDVLGAVVEQAAGMRFSDYLKKIIFEPLGMKDTTFHPTKEQFSRISSLYEYKENNILPLDKDKAYSLQGTQFESGGGGLVSSVDDYIRFADTIACGGTSAEGYRLLNPESIKRMQVNQLPAIASCPSFSCAAGPGYGYGLGVRTRISKEGGKSPIGEFGWDGAAGSYVMMDTENKISIFYAMHLRNWPRCVVTGHGPIRDMVYEEFENSNGDLC